MVVRSAGTVFSDCWEIFEKSRGQDIDRASGDRDVGSCDPEQFHWLKVPSRVLQTVLSEATGEE